MNRQEVQKAVIAKLRRTEEPLRIGELIAQIRGENPDFQSVPDFDFRTAVLALTANGQIQSTSTNRIHVRVAVGAARG